MQIWREYLKVSENLFGRVHFDSTVAGIRVRRWAVCYLRPINIYHHHSALKKCENTNTLTNDEGWGGSSWVITAFPLPAAVVVGSRRHYRALKKKKKIQPQNGPRRATRSMARIKRTYILKETKTHCTATVKISAEAYR